MSCMFSYSPFNGDISKWDTSNVLDMSYIFLDNPFDGNISDWDVRNVEKMYGTLEGTQISCDLTNWQPYKVFGVYMHPQLNKCPIPYWAVYIGDPSQERTNAINEYAERKKHAQMLEDKLNSANVPEKKRVKV